MTLSIIVPIYGVEKYLRPCLDSIAAQQGVEFEVLTVDDGGCDGCPAIIDEYASKDSRFVAIHKSNAGYGAAVNTGLERARGDWIGIVEPDDWIEPDMYRTLLARADSSTDIVKANFRYIHPWGIVRKGINCIPPSGRTFTISEFPELLTVHPSIWTCLYRRRFLDEKRIRMKEIPGAGWADNPFLHETMCQARGIAFVDRPVYNYRAPFEDPIIAKSDWLIPHDRLMEICAWLRARKISDVGVWDGVYQRLLYCCGMMALMRRDRVNVRAALQELIRQVDPSKLNASGILSRSTVMKYRLFRHHPLLAVPVVRLYLELKKAKMFLQLPFEKRRLRRNADEN